MPIYNPGKVIFKKETVIADPYWNNVSLLLHGNGTNGSTSIIDSSPSPKTLTAFGNAQISTAQSRFQSSISVVNPNTSGDINRVTTPNDSAFNYGSDNFTIDLWVYLNSSSGGGIVGKQRQASDWGEYVFAVLGTSRFLFFGCNTGGESLSGWNMLNLTSSVAVPLQSWAYVAVTRNGPTFSLWLNGANVGTATSSSSIFSGSSLLSIGSSKDGGQFGVNAYLDEVRITKGVARDVSVVPTAPFPDGP